MKFFVPKEADAQKAEQLYQAAKKFTSESTGWKVSNRRIRSITYRDKGRIVTATVGEPEPREGFEPVIAILESETYFVCTPNRGVLRGAPILVGKSEVIDSEDFDA